ncbi:Ribosomal protein S11 [Moelleriella libera RCEF 2490]|uniref:Ribosomal protein S11 n=1 Tax=Moelleriella libera RCEF 2490 TaxID=1081109 RepID=A0A168C4K9_9HYPO|nr:Ribosomal protein S11 [Moelleriella libera RCEF 2490]
MKRPLATALKALPISRNANSLRLLSGSSAQWDALKARQTQREQAQPKPLNFLESVLNDTSASLHRPKRPNSMTDLSSNAAFQALISKPIIDTGALSGAPHQSPQDRVDDLEPYHFHVYSHKHNTHITCTKPNREPIISMSCGNIGYRKSRRGTFDSAYSLTKYVLERLIHTGWPMKMRRLELVLRGFGQGREAVVKVLMSPEGKILREKIVRVADSTRIKFGGTRSEKPRRL